jgi:hypothetical protein
MEEESSPQHTKQLKKAEKKWNCLPNPPNPSIPTSKQCKGSVINHESQEKATNTSNPAGFTDI